MTRLDLSAQWYWEQDESLRFVRVEAFDRRQCAIGETLVGKQWRQIPAANQGETTWSHHFELLSEREPFFNFEIEVIQAPGQPQWFSLSGVPVHDACGNFNGYRGVGKDITSLKATQATIASLTLIDQLTGLSNRRLLLERLNFARLSGARTHEFGALIFVDIDNFKSFNEAVGHEVADILLVEVGARLSACMRDCDTVARMGGDVFVVLATDMGMSTERASQKTQKIVNKIVAALDAPFTPAMDIALTVSPQAPRFTASMGICLFQGTDTSVEDVMKRAELALRQAKQTGRQGIRYFDPLVEAQVRQRSQMETELHAALSSNQLRLHYQPIVDLQTKVIGYEALVRWQHPSLGLVAPGVFIAIAEQCGLIVPMGEWIIRQACEQLVAFQSSPSTATVTIAVNLSARQLAQADIAEVIAKIVRTSGAPANRLKLEITESMLLTDIDNTIEKLDALNALGIRFSLDDFGTGYSSLSYLKKLPLSQLKVDQSFVKGLLTDPVDAAIVKTIIQLAKSLGMSVIAEGVELEGQRKVLSDMGCREFQGYLFGKPAPLGIQADDS